MRIFLTTDQFIWNGMSRPDIPFICNSNMELTQVPNKYLRFIATIKGRTRSPRTWITYANHLYEFLSFLEVNEIAWNKVSQATIASWRDSMIERGCKRSTVNQRLRGIHNFYEWTLRQGISISIPFYKEDVWVSKNSGFLSHLDVSANQINANAFTMQTHKSMPKFLHLEKAIFFLEAIPTHSLKLMGYLALLTGMRRAEIIELDLRVLPNPAGNDPSKQLPMILDASITPTKGEKTRTVMLPYDLAVALWEYFRKDWPKRNKLHKLKYGKESNRFFLSTYGDELSLCYLNNSFAKVSKKIDIKCHPHMLRHTYGTYELLRIGRKQGTSKALLWVRDRMGHSSITTTEKYLHAADLVENDDVDGYQLQILEALTSGH